MSGTFIQFCEHFKRTGYNPIFKKVFSWASTFSLALSGKSQGESSPLHLLRGSDPGLVVAQALTLALYSRLLTMTLPSLHMVYLALAADHGRDEGALLSGLPCLAVPWPPSRCLSPHKRLASITSD